jgi:hypothetical protein
MPKPSPLTEKKWAEVERRFMAGESAASLAKEFKIERSSITRRFTQQKKTVNTVANQMLTTEKMFSELDFKQQTYATDLYAKLRSISGHLAGAAEFGAATAHRASGIAHSMVQKIDDANPLDSAKALVEIATLTNLANESSKIGLSLLAANKEMIKRANDEEPHKLPILPGITFDNGAPGTHPAKANT